MDDVTRVDVLESFHQIGVLIHSLWGVRLAFLMCSAITPGKYDRFFLNV
jgi:hypothetical protein